MDFKFGNFIESLEQNGISAVVDEVESGFRIGLSFINGETIVTVSGRTIEEAVSASLAKLAVSKKTMNEMLSNGWGYL